MRIAQIIGTVTLNQSLSSLQGNRLKLAVPLSQADLRSTERPMAEPLVVFDDLGPVLGWSFEHSYLIMCLKRG